MDGSNGDKWIPDYESGSIHTTQVTSFTMPDDGYVCYYNVSGSLGYQLQINNSDVGNVINPSGGTYYFSFYGFAKKGDIIKYSNNATMVTAVLKIYKLKQF